MAETTCGICLDPIFHMQDDSPVAIAYNTECGHEFHASCVRQWTEQGKRNCPNCRAEWRPTKPMKHKAMSERKRPTSKPRGSLRATKIDKDGKAKKRGSIRRVVDFSSDEDE
jgi:hypothetical protein